MILISEAVSEKYAAAGVWGKATLDGLLARHAAMRPHSPALFHRQSEEGQDSIQRAWCWEEMDRHVSALAAIFLNAGLRQDEVVGIQLGNTAQAIISYLAALRAGLIPAALPPLWRRRELVAACARLSPAALLGTSAVDGTPHEGLMCAVAAESPSVRHVFAFGNSVPDGVQSLDAALSDASAEAGGRGSPRAGNPADHVAIVTLRAVDDAITPIARSHNQWLSAGTVVVLAARLGPEATIATPLSPTSLAGLAAGLVAWLLTGCRLQLLLPQDVAQLPGSLAGCGTTHLVIPGAISGTLIPRAGVDPLKLVRVWRDPARPLLAITGGTDILSLGEMALLGVEESDRFTIPLTQDLDTADGATLKLLNSRIQGDMQKARQATAPGALLSGELMVSGPQVPGGAFPHSPERTPEYDERDRDGFRSTGLRCRLVDARPPRARIVGHSAETFTHGGIVLQAGEIDGLYASVPGVRDAAVIPVPDPLLGHRFHAAIVPEDEAACTPSTCRDYLKELGVAPYLLPERIVMVAEVPRATDGAVLRSLIESETAA